MNFFDELKRRNVYKVAVAYAVAGWALAQGIAQVFPVFDIPNWAVRLIVLVIVIGFPIALVIAWAFELTPEGIKRTEDVDPAVDSRAKSHAWIYVVIVAALLSISLFLLGRFTASTKQNSANEVPAKSIAVLPFENLSGDKLNAFFADGVQNEILTDLARIADLKVISRTSVMQQIAAYNYRRLRRYTDAKSAWDRLLAITPDDVTAKAERAMVDLDWKGDTRPLHQMIDSIRATNPAAVQSIADRWLICALAEREAAVANNALIAFGENPIGLVARMWFLIVHSEKA